MQTVRDDFHPRAGIVKFSQVLKCQKLLKSVNFRHCYSKKLKVDFLGCGVYVQPSIFGYMS